MGGREERGCDLWVDLQRQYLFLGRPRETGSPVKAGGNNLGLEKFRRPASSWLSAVATEPRGASRTSRREISTHSNMNFGH